MAPYIDESLNFWSKCIFCLDEKANSKHELKYRLFPLILLTLDS
jgi:hypothetical protein